MTTTTLSKEKLFAYIIVDDIQVEEEVVNKAKVNDAVSLSEIADIYYHKKDYLKAIDWYRLAAAESNGYSQRMIGYMYQYGLGISVDYKLAMEWYLKAHNNESIEATTSIGALYGKGLGVNQDYKTALKWYLEAAEKGEKYAQNNIGAFYECGYGVNMNKKYALEWYEKSAEQGFEDAKNAIARLNKEGFYIDDRQKRYLQMEKDNKEQKEKINVQEEQILKLKESIHVFELKEQEKDNEIRLLKQELEVLKLNINVPKKAPTVLNEHQSRQSIIESTNTLLSNIDLSETAQDDPRLDIYYDN